MSAITLEQAQEQLAAWLQCSLAVAKNQAYTIGERSFTRANAAWIQNQIQFWQREVNRLTRSGGIRVRRAVPE